MVNAAALQTYFGTLDVSKGVSGTPLNLSFWRTSIELYRMRSTGCMSGFRAESMCRVKNEKLNASEGNEPRKASSPLPFREVINNFVRNLSVIGKI